ncbi:MAG: cobalamin B12-binding domain-containing protein, partial [Gammaproteobacteria bacterium]|nr:cobalamin B12-binding domain-containing protein [Gammaproteobacteria bacterium]
ESVFAPALREVGDRWHAGTFTIGQERLVSGPLRRRIGSLLDCCNGASTDASVVFVTLSGERHELGILMYATLAASRRVRVGYLGPDVPPVEIADFARKVGAAAVALSLVTTDALASELSQLAVLRAALDPATEIWIGGPAALAIPPSKLPPGTVRFTGPADFEARIALLGGTKG